MSEAPTVASLMLWRRHMSEQAVHMGLAKFVVQCMKPGQLLTYQHHILNLFSIDVQDEYESKFHRMKSLMLSYTMGRCRVYEDTITGQITIERTEGND